MVEVEAHVAAGAEALTAVAEVEEVVVAAEEEEEEVVVVDSRTYTMVSLTWLRNVVGIHFLKIQYKCVP